MHSALTSHKLLSPQSVYLYIATVLKSHKGLLPLLLSILVSTCEIVNVGTIFQYQIINWSIPIIISTPPPPVEEPWNFQGKGCINLGISRGGGGLTL